ncbi:ribulose-phosphate 3-epimerase [Methanomassiliicoccus luminyensis]|jgi:ribulose-phosphate 3-epimerase|uniref:ribulose-phosphate 3-epimerase n=1 Tax=Methanomassiliicoccus luminyensis TaxID=1080712 RepID=UPI0003694C2F|nr:ribulose-phosphate 3-epimerase [Methanomassiliicoccus luminyensis]
MIKVAPSILSADFSRLGEEVRRVEREGADWVHVDVMDGVFVPNITIGPMVVQHLRPHTKLPFDVHLMIREPEKYVEDFAKAGADYITIHVEASRHVSETLDRIHALGKKAGLSLNPETPFDHVVPYLDKVDLLLIMTVHPGFGGQSFMPEVVPKIALAREYFDEIGNKAEIEIDGGINYDTGKLCVKEGATALAAGSALFKAPDMGREMQRWKAMDRA